MPVRWEICGARAPKAQGLDFICYKKKGHTESKSRDTATHVDTKTFPPHRWKEEANESR